ncbi:amidohydrolase [Pseudoalteromonas sp. NBT06-2]|uniref:amidohydrolase n=1 Tax=Pseudoalteromonas sp. NBT06-2 TaxID=2025950 RepID=UPI000BA54236|nr:amidohydrolase [Pseudoalteromonas sp. NBT06-2]PAJ72004.1 amidohydrolase [Pseudoalteromonas sp. NBT06-2]
MSTLTITTVQTDITWLNVTNNLNTLSAKLKNITDTDLILLPETFSTGFAINLDVDQDPINGQALNWLVEQSTKLNTVIAGSVLVSHKNKKANRFYWVWPDGTIKYYDKRHLFRLGNEGDHVIAGENREVFKVNGVKVLPLICYDLRFPVWARNRNDYDVIVNVANWPATRRNIWDTLLQARAIENQSYVIGINRVGDDGNGTAHSGGTAIYDFCGETLFNAKDNEIDISTTTIDITKLKQFKAAFPVHLDADEFNIV